MFISSVVIQSSAKLTASTWIAPHRYASSQTRHSQGRSYSTISCNCRWSCDVTSCREGTDWPETAVSALNEQLYNDCSQLVSHSLCVSYVRAVAQKWGAHSVCFAVRWSLHRSAQDLVSSLSKCAAMSGAALNLHFYSFDDSTLFSVVYQSILICLFSVFAC